MNVFVYDPYVNQSEIKKSGAVIVDNYKDNSFKEWMQ